MSAAMDEKQRERRNRDRFRALLQELAEQDGQVELLFDEAGLDPSELEDGTPAGELFEALDAHEPPPSNEAPNSAKSPRVLRGFVVRA